MKQNKIGICALILALISLFFLKNNAGIIILLFSLLLSLFSMVNNKYSRKAAAFALCVCLIGFIIASGIRKNEETTKEHKEYAKNMTNGVNELQPTAESSAEESADAVNDIDYKSKCEELWYDDIFFSKESLKGKYVKLYLFVEEENAFSIEDSMYDSTVSAFIQGNDLQRTFYKCGVLHEGTNSYVGGQIDLFIPSDSDCLPDGFGVEKKIVLYGEIVNYSTSTWNGYNECGVIPRYIDYLQNISD